MRYEDLGPDHYEQQAAIRRKIAYHVREIEALGLEVTICRPKAQTRTRARRVRNTQAA
jgi:hypothetical protein